MNDFIFHQNNPASSSRADLSVFNDEVARRTTRFHGTFAEYAPTPLVELKHLAAHWNLGQIIIKDESYRFGLNSFKVLGGSYAIGSWLAQKLGLDLAELSREQLASPDFLNKIQKTGPLTFASATDGNHGRGVAWTAAQLGHQAVIYMPRGSVQVRVDHILATGAQCRVTDLNYDDTVRFARDQAQKNGYILMQDTAWEGYEQIPTWVMQGYVTLADEILAEIKSRSQPPPTHLFLQAGVGIFAGAVLGRLAHVLGPLTPKTVIVEPLTADCIFRSAQAGDGQLHPVSGSLETIMAGLACGEPSLVSWGVLRDYPTAYISMADFHAACGMRIYAVPLPGDLKVISGESGASTLGALAHLAHSPQARDFKEALGLNQKSRVLLINTEGATAPDIYRQIVWGGRLAHGVTEETRAPETYQL